MLVGVPKETAAGERCVALVPELVPRLLKAGLDVLVQPGAGEAAELCVVNTCTVTHQADADGRHAIRRLARENPGTRIVVMGCYAARDPQTLRNMAGVAAVVDHPDRILTDRQLNPSEVEALAIAAGVCPDSIHDPWGPAPSIAPTRLANQSLDDNEPRFRVIARIFRA